MSPFATAAWRVGTPDPSISEVKQRAVRAVLGWETNQGRPDCCSLTKLSTKSSSGRDVKRGSRARGGASTTLISLITHNGYLLAGKIHLVIIIIIIIIVLILQLKSAVSF